MNHWPAFRETTVFDKSLKTPTSPFMPQMHSSLLDGSASSQTRAATSGSGSGTSVDQTEDSNTSRQSRKRQGNFRYIVANCNGARNKQAEIAELCSYTDPDAIIMCETKLDKSVKSCEFLPANYTTYVFAETVPLMGAVSLLR